MKLTYSNISFQVLFNNELVDFFTVNTGIDWVMKNVVNEGRIGIRLILTSFTDDLYFADDIALLSYASRHQDMQASIDDIIINITCTFASQT